MLNFNHYLNQISVKDFKNLLIIFFLTFSMLSSDIIQKKFSDANQSDYSLPFFFCVFIVYFLIWIISNKVLAITLQTLFSSFQFSQLLHISYLGHPLDPTTIASSISEADDISSSVTGTYTEHLHLILAVLVPYILNIYLICRFLPKNSKKTIKKFALLLLLLMLSTQPIRAINSDLVSFLPRPSNPSLFNSLNTFSFFIIHGFTSPEEAMPKSSIPAPNITSVKTDANTVWLIIVDSMRADHMFINGYERENTPNLMNWQRKGLKNHKGVAGAVATAASIPLMLNTIHDPGNLIQLNSKNTNLFKIAKESGFTTYFLSSQKAKIFKNLGNDYIDNYLDQDTYPDLFERQKDEGILDILHQQDFKTKNFVVILLRGAHAPYNVNYEHKRDQFAKWDDDENLNRIVEGTNSYDNSILYIDYVLDKLLQHIYNLNGENHVVITSDHGQLLGEENLWGHNVLRQEVATVPILSASWNAPNVSELGDSINNNYWISHFEMSAWIAERLGKKITLPQYDTNRAFLQGKNLYGINQYIEIDMSNKEDLSLSQPIMTIDYIPYLNMKKY